LPEPTRSIAGSLFALSEALEALEDSEEFITNAERLDELVKELETMAVEAVGKRDDEAEDEVDDEDLEDSDDDDA
jgi:hypothetical protein